MPRNKPHTEKTKIKIGLANRGVWVKYNCLFCGKCCESQIYRYNKKKKHYCSMKCYANDRKYNWDRSEQPTYKGMSPYKSHRKYVKANPERISHLKARAYARKKNAKGQHTLQEWVELKEKSNNRCCYCGEEKPLTKDHIIPLSKNGTDYIENIQPLCRNCNSRKYNHIYTKIDFIKITK